MRVLYHEGRGSSSLNREKKGDFLNEESEHSDEAHDNKEPKHAQDGLGVDLISFHVYMIPQVGGIYKHKHGET